MPYNPSPITRHPLSRYWLLIGITALAVAGLFALVLVIGRAPGLSKLPFFAQFFHQALVVHVDLSVLVWFLAVACMFWSVNAHGAKPAIPYLEQSALIAFALGTLLIAASPLDPAGEAMMSNYIPVLYTPLFFFGLLLVFCGVGLMIFHLFTSSANTLHFEKPVQFGILSAAPIAATALLSFVWAYHKMPSEIEGEQYYEMLFWGGGHVLQFLHVQVVMVCWLLLAKGIKREFNVYTPHLYLLFAIGLASCLFVPLIYWQYPVESGEHRMYFTYLMIAANGIAPTILALWILPGIITFRQLRRGPKRALWSSLLMSFILFISGNALGALIEGQNVVIPAHYHGSIVGVTLAFMGAAYLWLPVFGYRDPAGWRLAYWQPIVYGIGQLMHIGGLAWSGGYGVLRKTPGGMDAVDTGVKVAMGFMGLGGLLAIIGGLMFVVVAFKAVWRNQ